MTLLNFFFTHRNYCCIRNIGCTPEDLLLLARVPVLKHHSLWWSAAFGSNHQSTPPLAQQQSLNLLREPDLPWMESMLLLHQCHHQKWDLRTRRHQTDHLKVPCIQATEAVMRVIVLLTMALPTPLPLLPHPLLRPPLSLLLTKLHLHVIVSKLFVNYPIFVTCYSPL